MNYSRLSLIGTRIRSTKFNSPSLYKCKQVTPVNTIKIGRSPGVPINESLLSYVFLCKVNSVTDFQFQRGTL